MPGLTADQVATFHEQGYLLLPRVFAPGDLQPLIEELSAVVDAKAREAHARGELSSLYEEHGFETRLAHVTRETPAAFNALYSGVHHGPALFRLITSPKLLDLAESLVGPEVMAHPAYRIRPKLPAHEATVVPWHQDAGYMEAECDGVLQLTVWIPLVDATVENGCLEVIPLPLQPLALRHRAVRGRPFLDIPEEELPPVEPVAVPVPFGGALLFSNLTPHRSTPNLSGKVRWSVDVRYQDAALPTGYQPEAPFLARSRSQPEAVVTSPEEFARLRAEYQPGPPPRRWPVEEPQA